MATNNIKTEKPNLKKRGPNGGARPGSGRKAFEPTDAERKQVEALSGYGVPIEQIAVLVRDGICLETLTKYFSRDLINGKAKANGQVGKTLFQKVMEGDTTAAIWWTKTQMRWRETQLHEVSGPNGGSIAVIGLDASKLSTDALKQLIEAKRSQDTD